MIRRLGRRGKARLARLRAVAPAIEARSNGRCENPWCRKPTKEPPHHIIHRSLGGSDDVENLVKLCRGCHDAVHGGRLAVSGSASAVTWQRRDLP